MAHYTSQQIPEILAKNDTWDLPKASVTFTYPEGRMVITNHDNGMFDLFYLPASGKPCGARGVTAPVDLGREGSTLAFGVASTSRHQSLIEWKDGKAVYTNTGMNPVKAQAVQPISTAPAIAAPAEAHHISQKELAAAVETAVSRAKESLNPVSVELKEDVKFLAMVADTGIFLDAVAAEAPSKLHNIMQFHNEVVQAINAISHDVRSSQLHMQLMGRGITRFFAELCGELHIDNPAANLEIT